MSRWELIGSATVPGAGGELRLYQRHDEFSLRIVGQGELMNSRTHGSEDALGKLSSEPLAGSPSVSLLIGGLGMGFTLAAALAELRADASLTVAELVPEVLTWNEALLGHCAGHPLQDSRVHVRVEDVGSVIAGARAEFDAILLDVDNGPEGLTRRANDRLYSHDGLVDAFEALKPKGTLAIWSAGPDSQFTHRLEKTGFSVTERMVRAHGKKGSRHVIWFASRPV